MDNLAVVGIFERVGGPLGEFDLGGSDAALPIGDVPGGKELKDGARDGTFMAGGWDWGWG